MTLWFLRNVYQELSFYQKNFYFSEGFWQNLHKKVIFLVPITPFACPPLEYFHIRDIIQKSSQYCICQDRTRYDDISNIQVRRKKFQQTRTLTSNLYQTSSNLYISTVRQPFTLNALARMTKIIAVCNYVKINITKMNY